MKQKQCMGPLTYEVREMPTRIRFQKLLHDQLAKDAYEKPFDL